jgi:hypothetical protein
MTPESRSTEPAAELLTRVAETRAAQDRAAAVHDQVDRTRFGGHLTRLLQFLSTGD